MRYVIYLESNMPTGLSDSHYGYWTGKCYVVNQEPYPICEDQITEKTKFYKSKKVADKVAQGMYEKYAYVSDAVVEEIGE